MPSGSHSSAVPSSLAVVTPNQRDTLSELGSEMAASLSRASSEASVVPRGRGKGLVYRGISGRAHMRTRGTPPNYPDVTDSEDEVVSNAEDRQAAADGDYSYASEDDDGQVSDTETEGRPISEASLDLFGDDIDKSAQQEPSEDETDEMPRRHGRKLRRGVRSGEDMGGTFSSTPSKKVTLKLASQGSRKALRHVEDPRHPLISSAAGLTSYLRFGTGETISGEGHLGISSISKGSTDSKGKSHLVLEGKDGRKYTLREKTATPEPSSETGFELQSQRSDSEHPSDIGLFTEDPKTDLDTIQGVFKHPSSVHSPAPANTNRRTRTETGTGTSKGTATTTTAGAQSINPFKRPRPDSGSDSEAAVDAELVESCTDLMEAPTP